MSFVIKKEKLSSAKSRIKIFAPKVKLKSERKWEKRKTRTFRLSFAAMHCCRCLLLVFGVNSRSNSLGSSVLLSLFLRVKSILGHQSGQIKCLGRSTLSICHCLMLVIIVNFGPWIGLFHLSWSCLLRCVRKQHDNFGSVCSLSLSHKLGSEWSRLGARAKRAVRNKWTVERWKWANE